MTFEEIREMVNATINENGKREITGKAINLALLETLTAIEEFLANNKPEGAASETFFLPNMSTGELKPERQAHNAEVYNKFKAAFESGKPLPLLSVDYAFQLDFVEESLGQPANAAGYVPCITVVFVPTDSPLAEQAGSGIMFVAISETNNAVQGLITSDGNVVAAV